MKNKIRTVCLDCGEKYDKKHKSSFGIWIGTCDICGKKKVACASGPHDFGIYSTKEIEIADKVQDLI